MTTELRTWLMDNGSTLQEALFVGLAALLFVLERLWPQRSQPVRRRAWATNLVATLAAIAAMSLVPVGYVAAALMAEATDTGFLNGFELPLWALAVATLLLRGLLSTSIHLLMHKVPLLWRLHRVHHLDTGLDVTTTVRFHPLEPLVTASIGAPIVLGLGLTPWVLVAYEVLDVVITLWSHSNLRLPSFLDSALRYVVVTPNIHRIHHSSWQPETDSNYSPVLPIWDVLLGTFRRRPRVPHELMEIGLEVRDARTQNLGWLLLSPLYELDSPGGAAVAGTRAGPGGAR